MKNYLTTLSVLATFVAPPSFADQVIAEDLIVQDNICAGGSSCADGESFGIADIKVKATIPAIEFDDTNSGESDWRISIDRDSIALDKGFVIENITHGVNALSIEDSPPDNALYINTDGDVGLGTAIPGADLHVMASASNVRLILEETFNTDGGVQLNASNTLFSIQSLDGGTAPFHMLHAAPTGSFRMQSNGDIGLGTASPEGKLHTKGDGVQLAYFESGDGDAVQVRFRTDSENRRFLAVDNADNVKTQMQFRDNAILFLGETVAQEWLNVSAAGITTAGPTCNPGPCDATFDPDAFEVPSIKDHAAYMWENQHLWAVGPTKPGEPFNLTQKTGAILHELEVAHIYIEELHDRLENQQGEIASLSARLNAIEAQ